MSYQQIIPKIVVVALAAYRLAYLFGKEDAPFDFALNLRRYFGRLAAANRDKQLGGIFTTIAKLFNCPHCLGLWFALIISAALFGATVEGVIIWLSASGLQSFLYGLINKEESL